MYQHARESSHGRIASRSACESHFSSRQRAHLANFFFLLSLSRASFPSNWRDFLSLSICRVSNRRCPSDDLSCGEDKIRKRKKKERTRSKFWCTFFVLVRARTSFSYFTYLLTTVTRGYFGAQKRTLDLCERNEQADCVILTVVSPILDTNLR